METANPLQHLLVRGLGTTTLVADRLRGVTQDWVSRGRLDPNQASALDDGRGRRGETPELEEKVERDIERNRDNLLQDIGVASQKEVDELRAASTASSSSCVNSIDAIEQPVLGPESTQSDAAAMRDILISSTVCVLCLLLALVSQLVAPSTVDASANTSAATAGVVSQLATTTAAARPSFELDPNDLNPTLFAMAPDTNQADASALAALDAPYTQIKASGLKITELKVKRVPKPLQPDRSGHYWERLKTARFDASYDRGTSSPSPGAGRVIAAGMKGGWKGGGKRKL